MGKKALTFIVSAGQTKAISKQRTLLARTVKQSEVQVSEVSEHITEAESLGLELGSSAITQFFEVILASQSQLVAIESPRRLAFDAAFAVDFGSPSLLSALFPLRRIPA
jgi:hypothetical protein